MTMAGIPLVRGQPRGLPLRVSSCVSFWGRVCISAPTRKFVSGRCRGFLRELPAAQGLRARRHWPSPRASVAVPGPRLLPSPSPLRLEEGDPGEGSDAAQSGFQTASVRVPAAARVARPRAWKRVRRWGSPFGVRRLPWISFSGFSRAVASLLRRTGVDVCRLHAGLPALGWGIPVKMATTRVAPTEGMPAGSLCDAGLMRRAPGTRPPALRHGPPGLAPDFRSDEGRRRRTLRRCGSARWIAVLSLPFCLCFLTYVSLWPLGSGSAHVCATLCRSVDLFVVYNTCCGIVKLFLKCDFCFLLVCLGHPSCLFVLAGISLV